MNKRYTAHLYYGGERPDEKLHTVCVKTARLWVEQAEHGIIQDNLTSEIIE